MRKIDIYVGGVYTCSTTQSASLTEAKRKFMENPIYAGLVAPDKLGMVKADTAQTVTVQWAAR